MADYYPLLAKALAGIAPGEAEARARLFDRARGALLTQLRSMEPPLSEIEITRQRLALEEAIRRADEDTGGARRSVWPADGPARAEPAAPVEPVSRQAVSEPLDGKPAARPRVEQRERRAGRRFSAPQIGLMLLPLILAVAAAAYYLNGARRPAEGVVLRPNQAAGRGLQNPPKTAERVGVPAAAQPAAQTAAAPPATASPLPAQRPQAPAAQPAAQAPAQASAPPPAALPVMVAQRAFLIEEQAEGGQSVNTSAGSVAWLLDSVAGGTGQPLENVIRARLDFPLVKLRAEITFRRNIDPALPASHTIEVGFLPARDAATGNVREIGLLEMRETDTANGVALLGPQPIFVAENLFLIGLSSSDAVRSRNLAMLSGRDWVFFELRFSSGRRAAILFEKGTAGQQVFADAFERWK